MRTRFVKMHGLGNDFVVLDGRECELPELDPLAIRRIADRREGIGCDQLIVLEDTDTAGCDLRMRIFNADGSEVEACGNASRAVAVLIGRAVSVETLGGTVILAPEGSGASVALPMPQFGWEEIPLAYAMDTAAMPVAWEELQTPAAVRVGNPHVVFFVPDCASVDLARLGPLIETDPLFPERINVNVATVDSRQRIRSRVWERGAGLTRACGTGACATAVAAMRRGLVDRRVTVALPGGELAIAWEESSSVLMSGPAVESFRGSFDWSDYA